MEALVKIKLGLASLLFLLLWTLNDVIQANETRPDQAQDLRIAMLHLALEYADLEHNASLVKRGIELAAAHEADWVMTPELTFTGYRFDLQLGTVRNR